MKFVFFILFFIVTICGVFSLGSRARANNPQNPPITEGETVSAVGAANGVDAANSVGDVDTNGSGTRKIIGKVQIYGSEPRTFVGIVDQDKTEYAVYPASQENELRKLQGHLIEFTVVFLDEPQGYGSLFLKGGTVTPVKWEIIQ